MKKFAIYGVGGFGRDVMPLARHQLSSINVSHELVFIDDSSVIADCNGHRVMTYDEWISSGTGDRYISIAISNSVIREKLAQKCQFDGVKFFQISSQNSVRLDDVQIGEGAILCPFVTLASNVRIGRHFHANIYSYVEHDCFVGDFVTFAPGVKCNGNVIIDDHVYIGAGAVIRQGKPGMPLVIGRGAVIGMGAVVTDNVPPATTVVGNPARLLVKGEVR